MYILKLFKYYVPILCTNKSGKEREMNTKLSQKYFLKNTYVRFTIKYKSKVTCFTYCTIHYTNVTFRNACNVSIYMHSVYIHM